MKTKMNNTFKIKAKVVLSEIEVEVDLNVDKVFWLTSDSKNQANAVWSALMEEYPLSMEIACENTTRYPQTSYIESMTITN